MKTDNEIIDEFMGVAPKTEYLVTHYAYDKHFNGWISQSSYDDVKHLNTTGLEATRIKQNPYDTSWDWLMPVVEKLIKDGYEYRQNEDETSLYLFSTDHYILISETGISGAYKAVVEFIKWYNTQAPKVKP